MPTLSSTPRPARPGGADLRRERDVAPFRFGPRDHLINLGFWTLFGAVTAANMLSNDHEPAGERRVVAETIFWLFDAYLWAAVTPLVFWMVWRFRARPSGRVRQGALIAATTLGVAILVDLTQALFGEYVLGLPGRFASGDPAWWVERWERLDEEPIMCASIFAVAFVRQYLLRVRADHERALRVQASAAESEARMAQLQAQLASARLMMLRSQINPHFLFNSLNAVSALIQREPEGALRMVARLSELLRSALEDRDGEEIPLREELRLTRLYLEILEIRFQGRLRTSIAVEPDTEDAQVPSLILQPLVENAMKHGVAKARGRGSIEIRARRSGDSLVLTVCDSGGGAGAHGPAELAAAPAGTGVGLSNTRARLRELYGDHQEFSLLPRPEGGMSAEVVLPFRPAAEPQRA